LISHLMHFVLNHIPRAPSRKKGGPRTDGMDERKKNSLMISRRASAQIAHRTMYKIHLSPLSSETHDLNVKKAHREMDIALGPLAFSAAQVLLAARTHQSSAQHSQKALSSARAESAYGNTSLRLLADL
jgi:hypothetical protein